MEPYNIVCKESRLENNNNFYCQFILGPLKEEVCLTIGNSLRRSLLSFKAGLAITSVTFSGYSLRSNDFCSLHSKRSNDVLLLSSNSNEQKRRILQSDCETKFEGFPVAIRRMESNKQKGSKDEILHVVSQDNQSQQQQDDVIQQNVLSEYSTIKGAKESVFYILLSLSNIVFKQKPARSFFKRKATTQQTILGYLKVQGPAVIKAKDLILPFFIECIDPEHYITTLADDGFLNLQIVISVFDPLQDCSLPVILGSNAFIRTASVFKQKKQGSEGLFVCKSCDYEVQAKSSRFKKCEVKTCNTTPYISNISKAKTFRLEPSFSPVIKVNYTIENVKTDYSFKSRVLILEIITNGSLHPRIVLNKAIYNLNKTFNNLLK